MKKFSSLFILLLIIGCSNPKPYIPPYEYSENQLAKLLYDRAITYREQGNYELAIIEFRHFIDYYPKIYYADEAQLNIAKCYQALGQFNEAINNYQILSKKYKQSDHKVEAVYHIGECYQASDKVKQSAETYLSIIKKHSETNWAKAAKEQIQELTNKFPQSKWLRKLNRTADKMYRKSQKK
ncbi:MAG: tetratricopeptide repeat protein [bacterium]|nr:tetratricopeptide repeat protein [bacterium]